MIKRFINTEIITTGLAIFSMFFGAGNLMFPIQVGLEAGNKNPWAIAGFLLTAILIPLTSLIAIILFQGDYIQFFYRLGRIPGFLFMSFCALAVGPLFAMPRIVTLSYTMVSPFIPQMSLIIFSLIFLGFTFLATYKESKIIDFLGKVISPLLLISLIIIIIKGYLTPSQAPTPDISSFELFWKSATTGYQALDILAGIFFSSIIITILQQNYTTPGKPDFKQLATMSLKAGIIGLSLLAIVYIGMTHLGAHHGYGLEHINPGELFSAVSFRVLGKHGALIIATAVLMACYSTIIALTAVVAEFFDNQVFNHKLGYIPSVILTIALTMIPSTFGLSAVLNYSKPIIIIVYPALIVLTFLNIAYKLFNFKPIKTPVAITLLISLVSYFM